jgi:hypothetical protein
MRFSEVLWEVVGSDGSVGGHYGLTDRSWRLSSWVLAMWFHLSLHEKEVDIGRRYEVEGRTSLRETIDVL